MRLPVDRFAAHIAHFYNDNSQEFDFSTVYAQALLVLERRFLVSLLYYPRYEWRMPAEEAAEKYFSLVFERPIVLTGKSQFSVTHYLLLALCETQECAGHLFRSLDTLETGLAFSDDESMRLLKKNLAACARGISKNSASKKLQGTYGTLYMALGDSILALPEELSIWDCLSCAPRRCASLPAGEAFNTLCSRFIDAFRSANRPFQEVLGLGGQLCPFDWLESLSVNQVKSIRRFNKACVALENDFLAAWQTSPVTGFKDYQSFRSSEIGAAINHGGIQHVSTEDYGDLADDRESATFMGSGEFEQQISILQKGGTLVDVEAQMLQALYRGDSIKALRDVPAFKRFLRQNKLNVEQWMQSVLERIDQL